MSIRVHWHHDVEQLLVVRFTSRWTWSAFFRSKAVVDALLDETDTPVNCLFLLPSDIILPPGSIRNGQQAYKSIHPKIKQIIVVKPNILIRTIYGMVIKKDPTIPDFIILADSQDQALQLLDVNTLN